MNKRNVGGQNPITQVFGVGSSSSSSSTNSNFFIFTLVLVAVLWTLTFLMFAQKIRQKDSAIQLLKAEIENVNKDDLGWPNQKQQMKEELVSMRKELASVAAERVRLLEKVEALSLQVNVVWRNDKPKTDNSSKKKKKFIISINSAQQHLDRREWIRSTWGNTLKTIQSDAELLFYYGQILDNPKNIERPDVMPFSEADKVLSETSRVIKMIYYVYDNYAFDYLFFLDDLSLLNPWTLTELTSKWPNTTFRGACNTGGMTVIHDENSYYNEPHYRDCSAYPPYCSAGLFALSHDLVEQLVSYNFPLRTLRNWDTAFGVWLSAIEMARPENDRVFVMDAEPFRNNPMKYLVFRESEARLKDAWAQLEQINKQ